MDRLPVGTRVIGEEGLGTIVEHVADHDVCIDYDNGLNALQCQSEDCDRYEPVYPLPKELVEAEKQSASPPNTSSFQFPKLEDITTEVHCRLNKKHLPWVASAIVAVSETYDIIVGNKKR